ncbi:MAG TPA: cellulose synthase operon protein YhjQ/BcsQ [Actinomycetota bacterium]|nr:cellulose synthase operon protein YhjQ/BcsQ [Actinomycetota bacterium]
MEDVARIVLGIEAHDVAEEVMHFLDRTGRARVVATAADDRQLAEAVRQLEPDAVVAQPGLVRRGTLDGAALLALETRESVGALRAALEAGARGFFLWPAEREALAAAAGRIRAQASAAERRARVVGVYGPRGGVGTTFLATHLAAALAARGTDCLLVDLDPSFGDVAVALGAPLEPPPRTLADLLPAEELTPARVDEVAWRHPAGFRALLAPEPEPAADLGPEEVAAVVGAAAGAADVALLHLPRALGAEVRPALEVVERLFLVVTLDVLAFRAARRALDRLEALGVADRVEVVVNRAARAELTPADVEPALGRAAVAVLPRDGQVAPAQDHGRLLPLRGRTGRALLRLARRVEALGGEGRP